MGGRVTGLVARGQTWRLVSGIFLHGGLLHLMLNVVGIVALGRLAEAIWGPGRMILLFALSGLGGSIASQLAGVPRSVGASGAIFGLLGALWAFGLLQRASLPHTLGVGLRRGVGAAIVMNLALGITLWMIVDNFAHLGGLIVGIVIVPFLRCRALPWESPSPTLGLLAGLSGGSLIAWGLLSAASRG
jgi:rhomboid protease GluP